jgi:hypothetical protein
MPMTLSGKILKRELLDQFLKTDHDEPHKA